MSLVIVVLTVLTSNKKSSIILVNYTIYKYKYCQEVMKITNEDNKEDPLWYVLRQQLFGAFYFYCLVQQMATENCQSTQIGVT